MGCTNNGDYCETDNHCQKFLPSSAVPGEGTSMKYSEYPVTQFRTGNYNIPDRTGNAVMHNSSTIPISTTSSPAGGRGNGVAADGGAAASLAHCGKVRGVGCNTFAFGGDGGSEIAYDWIPTDLSFDWQSSDTWLSYIFDTSNNAGIAGNPVYYIRTCTRTTSTTTQGTPQVPASTTTSTETTTTCVPCTAHTCSPGVTDVKYTYGGQDLTRDDDCPNPDLFGIGTESTKLVFTYSQLSSQLADGVTEFAVSYGGGAFEPVYTESLGIGQVYNSSQNPWQLGDESFGDFEVFDQEFETEETNGFRIKLRISPIFDDTGATLVFNGTQWEVMEVLNSGTGYKINDTFTLNYPYLLPDNTETTLTLELRVTNVGPSEILTGQSSGFDVIRTGDTVNGHRVLRAYHTDLDNFPHHVIYLSGDGDNFIKEQTYVSDRAHVIVAKAGYGIPDRACLVGKYEFIEKSVQYMTLSRDERSPDIFNEVKLPRVSTTVTNGVVTGYNIEFSGSKVRRSELNGNEPRLVAAGPPSSAGRPAVVEGIFSGGQLVSIAIVDGGSLYDDNDPPAIFVSNTLSQDRTSYKNAGYEEGHTERYKKYYDAAPTPNPDMSLIKEQIDSNPEVITVTSNRGNIDVKYDPESRRKDIQPQSLYSAGVIAPLYDIMNKPSDMTHLGRLSQKDLASAIVEEEANIKVRTDALLRGLTQDVIPSYNDVPDTLVETVQGRLGNLPYGSENTKYIIKQYSPDTASRATINVTLSCRPVAEGINTTQCPPPVLTIPGPTSSTDPVTGTATAASSTCTMTGPFGPGCASWSVSGEMLFLHDMSRSAQNAVAAGKAYGNPLLEV